MSSSQRRNNEQQHVFTRQATILRKNLFEWDHMLRTPRGELWPTMVGRLNAALNQTGTLDRSIDDVLEHFVYVPKQSPANPQDIPFFLSTRLAEENKGSGETTSKRTGENEDSEEAAPEEVIAESEAMQTLTAYENRAAQIANEYEENMVGEPILCSAGTFVSRRVYVKGTLSVRRLAFKAYDPGHIGCSDATSRNRVLVDFGYGIRINILEEQLQATPVALGKIGDTVYSTIDHGRCFKVGDKGTLVGPSTDRFFGRRRKSRDKNVSESKGEDGRSSEVTGAKAGYGSSSDMDSDVSDDSMRLHTSRMSYPERMMRKAQLQSLAEIDNGLRLDGNDEIPQEVTMTSEGFAQYRRRILAPAVSIRVSALLAAGDSINDEDYDDQDWHGSSAPRRHQMRRSSAQRALLMANLGLKVAADVE